MDWQPLVEILNNRVPRQATEITIVDQAVFFDMPKNWKPFPDTGIVQVDMKSTGLHLIDRYNTTFNRWKYHRRS